VVTPPGNLRHPAAYSRDTGPMTSRPPRTRRRVWRLVLAALVAVLAVLLCAGTASATTPTQVKTRVGTSTPAVAHVVGPHESITAGQRWGHAPPQAETVAATGVAAETAGDVPTVVFSRSRAPGIAGTFDDAVADGAPTQLNRVTGAARDANRRAALRGQSPAPAGQSLDEYPFACSAQGGCGSTVRSVPVGEQSYQGGVLSRFFQSNGIGVGDPFNVTFGP